MFHHGVMPTDFRWSIILLFHLVALPHNLGILISNLQLYSQLPPYGGGIRCTDVLQDSRATNTEIGHQGVIHSTKFAYAEVWKTLNKFELKSLFCFCLSSLICYSMTASIQSMVWHQRSVSRCLESIQQ